MSLGPLYVLLVEVPVQDFDPFFNWIVCLAGMESCGFFIYFGDQTLVQGIIGKYVLPYSQYPFHFDDGFFSCAETFKFDIVSFVVSFIPCPKKYISKNIAMWDV